MAILDPQAQIAMLERELEWAHLTIEKRNAQIRLLEERLRQRRIQLLGPHSETLSDLQLELLADEEPGVTGEEVEAEACREPFPPRPSAERKPHPGRRSLPGNLPRIEQVIRCADANCKMCGGETTIIGFDESEVLDVEPARWFVRVTKREKRACGKCASIAMAELEPRIVEKGLASDAVVVQAATTYPSTVSGTTSTPGASYNYSYDSMNRLSGMTTSTGTTVVSPVTYSPANQLLAITYNGVAETRQYNSLLQLANLVVPGANIEYSYPAGSNNGKLNGMWNWNGVSGELITYTYDSLNRLAAASGEINNVVQWGEAYKFDPFGNLTAKTLTGGSGQNASWTVNSGNNRINGVSYDANGNATNVYNGSVDYGLGYDAENRLTSALQTSENYVNYGYDSQNHRIWSWTGSLDMYGNASSYTLNVYNPVGQKLAAHTLVPELVLTGGSYVPTMQVTLSSSDQYFGNRRLAVIDQLGSGGNNSSTFGTYFPWGEPKGTTNPQDKWSYATYWADSFTGLDYANNRYYSNAYGRMMTPDPSSSSDASNPQSWNQYAYSYGDPVNNLDPSGLDPCGSSTSVGSNGVISVTVFECSNPPDGWDMNATPGAGWGAFNNDYDSGLVAAHQKTPYPMLTGSNISAASNALNLAKELASNTNCNKALSADGVSSISTLLQSINLAGPGIDVFNGMQSSATSSTGQSMSDYFNQNASSVAAVASLGTAANPGIIFLGNAFFNPALAGVSNGNYAYAQAIILMHEAVHSIGDLSDQAAGGSKALTQALVNNCIPVLGNQLGGLTN